MKLTTPFLTSSQRRPQILALDAEPSREEIASALRSLKQGKAPDPDGIPGELLRHGGDGVLDCLLKIIRQCWRNECVPKQWKDATIINIYKNKGDRAVCGNSRGISLLSAAGKVLSRILLSRIVEDTAEVFFAENTVQL